MPRSTVTGVLLTLTIVLTILGLATLIPHSSKMVSDLGYETFCPFAPYSTLTLLGLAGVGWVVRQYINSQPIQK
jgi:uncharacterized membrane protein YqjE